MRLLVGIDIHGRPDRFLRAVQPWAARLDAMVDLAHVSAYRPDEVRLEGASEALIQQVASWRALQRDEQQELERLRDSLPDRHRGRARLLTGRPSSTLSAQTQGYDLVLVGAQRQAGLARALLGSITRRVVRRAHCSVLVLRPDPIPLAVPKRLTVLAPLDWPPDPAPLDQARRWLGPVDVHVVHAIPPLLWALEDPSHRLPTDPEARRGLVREELADLLARRGLPHAGRVHVVDAAGDNPGTDVVRLGERVVAHLVVLATHGRRGLARLALGSVAERVVRLAECPVLVTRLGGGSS